MRIKRITVAFLSAFALFMSACSSEKPKPRRGRAKPKAAASKAKSKSTATLEVPSILGKAEDAYSYNPVGKRDPFKAYQGETVQEVDVPRSPLERYDLDQLKLSAIVWGISNPRALVGAPDGKNYIVRKNMRLGKNRGRVARITRRQVFVEEEYRDPTGKLVVREAMMQIRAKESKTKLKMSDE